MVRARLERHARVLIFDAIAAFRPTLPAILFRAISPVYAAMTLFSCRQYFRYASCLMPSPYAAPRATRYMAPCLLCHYFADAFAATYASLLLLTLLLIFSLFADIRQRHAMMRL